MMPVVLFSPSVRTWSTLFIALASGAVAAFSGHPQDSFGGYVGHMPTVALIVAALAISTSLVSGFLDYRKSLEVASQE